jgi:hypothetical protein
MLLELCMFFMQKIKNVLNKTSLSKLVYVYFGSVIFVFIQIVHWLL